MVTALIRNSLCYALESNYTSYIRKTKRPSHQRICNLWKDFLVRRTDEENDDNIHSSSWRALIFLVMVYADNGHITDLVMHSVHFPPRALPQSPLPLDSHV